MAAGGRSRSDAAVDANASDPRHPHDRNQVRPRSFRLTRAEVCVISAPAKNPFLPISPSPPAADRRQRPEALPRARARAPVAPQGTLANPATAAARSLA